MIAAIVRAQLLSMRFGGRQGAVFSLIIGMVWYGFWCFAAFSIQELAGLADAATLRLWIPTGLLLIGLYWQVVPIFSASMGSGNGRPATTLYLPEWAFSARTVTTMTAASGRSPEVRHLMLKNRTPLVPESWRRLWCTFCSISFSHLDCAACWSVCCRAAVCAKCWSSSC